MIKYLFFLLIVASAVAQPTLNNYSVAIVPHKFDFQKQPDQHKINTHLKMFLEKYGFTTYFDSDVIPVEVAAAPCSNVYATLEDNSNLFTTKVRVILKDCTNNVFFTSDEGSTREKEYQAAYLQALRQAFASFERVNYKYSGKAVDASLTLAKAVEPVRDTRPAEQAVITADAPMTLKRLATGFEIWSGQNLYATLLNTSHPEIFIATKGDVQGVFLKSDGKWRIEYYDQGRFVSQEVNVKF